MWILYFDVILETPQHLILHFPHRAEHGFLTGTKLTAWVLETWDQQVKMKPIVGVYLCATAQITSAPKPGFSDSLFIHESILSVTPAGEKILSGQIRKSTSLQQSGALELQDVKVGGHHGRNLQVTHWHIFVILLHDDLKLCSTVVVCLRAQQTYMLARPQVWHINQNSTIDWHLLMLVPGLQDSRTQFCSCQESILWGQKYKPSWWGVSRIWMSLKIRLGAPKTGRNQRKKQTLCFTN